VEEEGHLPQVFIINENDIFCKKMPRRTYITKDEITLPGHEPTQDMLILLLDSNASGDVRFKPMLVYCSENPKVLKQHKFISSELDVYWSSVIRHGIL
jgi:hypothetical protein